MVRESDGHHRPQHASTQVRPDAPIELPEHFALHTGDTSGPNWWWEAFGSDEPNRLVEEALAGNFDLRMAWACLEQVDAVARQAGANRMPTLTYRGGREF
ncbi:MAG: hypothetical protein LJE94_17755 [Deltaproteobacteria bacterium]|nr:hypothetical protein [Deltaproteobacteria bacterium]